MEQGYRFTDRETGKEHEGDVDCSSILGDLDDHTHGIQILVECMSTSSPWAFFLGHARHNGPWLPTSNFDRDCALCDTMGHEHDALGRHTPEAYAVTEKRKKSARSAAPTAPLAPSQSPSP